MRLFFTICIAILCLNTQGQSVKKFKIFLNQHDTPIEKFDWLESYLLKKDFYTYNENWVILTDTLYIDQQCDSTRAFLGILGKYKQRCFDIYLSHHFKLVNDKKRNNYIHMETFGYSKQIGKIGYDPINNNNKKAIKEQSYTLKNDITTLINK